MYETLFRTKIVTKTVWLNIFKQQLNTTNTAATDTVTATANF
jgi:hypothetical protein